MDTCKTDTATGDTTVRSIWRNRNFLVLWSGQAVSAGGTNISTLALPLPVLALTRSPAQAGLIAAVQMLPLVTRSHLTRRFCASALRHRGYMRLRWASAAPLLRTRLRPRFVCVRPAAISSSRMGGRARLTPVLFTAHLQETGGA